MKTRNCGLCLGHARGLRPIGVRRGQIVTIYGLNGRVLRIVLGVLPITTSTLLSGPSFRISGAHIEMGSVSSVFRSSTAF